jgi:glycerol-3-phosphate acyltransferase PlsY
MEIIIFIIIAYLIGSIPFAQIIAGAHKIDIRKVGSGNIGATNLSRALGRKWGYFCFALDVLKGFIPVFVVSGFFPDAGDTRQLFCLIAVGIASIIGHIFPVYLKFKGGKGAATSFGVALGLWPYYTICALVAFTVWVFVVLIWRYVSLASIVAAVSFCITLVVGVLIVPGWNLSSVWPLVIVSVLIPALMIFRHRENIKRLMAGTERKVGQNKDD